MSDDIEGQDPITPEVGEPKPHVPEEPMVPKSQVDKLYARAKQAEEGERKLKEELEKVRPPQHSPQNFEKSLEEKFELRHLGYTPEEITFIKRNTPEGKSMLETVNDQFVKAAIDGKRSERSAIDATPTPSPRSLFVGDKSFKDMSTQERSENFSGDAWRRRKRVRG